MKKLFFILCLNLFSLVSSFAASDSRHFVFFVHGIAGKPENFGSLKEILLEQKKYYSIDEDIIVEKFQYNSGDNQADVNKISLQLSDFIIKKIQEYGGVDENDKISFVVHSQGGLITTRLLLRSAMNDSRYHPMLLKNYYSIVTLGTPFWGSKIAIAGSKVKALARMLGLDILTFFGNAQLDDLQVMSPAVDELRALLLEPFAQVLMEKLQEQIHFVHVAGMPEALKWLRPFVTGKNQFEDDTAVPLPSTQLDFSYYVENAEHKNKSIIHPEDFFETKFTREDNFYPVSAFHTAIIKESVKVHGIAYFPKKCLGFEYVYCPHPALAPVVETLFGLRKTRTPRTDYTSFAFDLRLRFNGRLLSEKEQSKLKIVLKPLLATTKIGKPGELYKRVRRWDKNGEYRLYHTGFIKQIDSYEGLVQMRITLPGYSEKTIQIPVKKGRTTHLDLTLLKLP